MEGCVAVNSEGKSGGLALLWREGVKVEVQNFSNYHIDSLVSLEESKVIRFTGFYGNYDPNARNLSWDMLRRVKRMVKEGWIVGGDFNAILNNAEKDGVERNQGEEGPNPIKERLDRFLISEDLVEKLPFINTRVVQQSKLEKKIGKIMDGPINMGSLNLLKTTRDHLGKLYDAEEKYWAQRAYNQWLREGDRNTRYFHVRVTGRKKKNPIDKLKDVNGVWYEDKNEICHIAWSYFHNPFKTSIRNQRKEVDVFMKTLDNFSRTSGQSINLEKSTVCFSPNTPVFHPTALGSLLKMKVVDKLDSYLGLPILAAKKRSSIFKIVLDRISCRINSWSKRLLSNGRKEIFIKSVLQSLPTYAFQFSWLLKG
ncbi:hypothetical protein GOBAR_DD16799 [Gossypium barbadense]|nr:hypothetical protein GOBAR_DD16799 [Gossypium barbadense]